MVNLEAFLLDQEKGKDVLFHHLYFTHCWGAKFQSKNASKSNQRQKYWKEKSNLYSYADNKIVYIENSDI